MNIETYNQIKILVDSILELEEKIKRNNDSEQTIIDSETERVSAEISVNGFIGRFNFDMNTRDFMRLIEQINNTQNEELNNFNNELNNY
jgi:hypothetical protein